MYVVYYGALAHKIYVEECKCMYKDKRRYHLDISCSHNRNNTDSKSN